MIICPECQNENLEEEIFCQECGASLTDKNCEECGELLPIGVEHCPACNAFTLSVYNCIVTSPSEKALQLQQKNETKEDFYLDSEWRYRLFSQEKEPKFKPFLSLPEKDFYIIKVLDFKPLQKSILDNNLEKLETVDRKSLVEAGIPAIAFPYLTLSPYNPTIPELYDAWINQETEQELVIISEQKEHIKFTELLEDSSKSQSRLIDYFEKMAKLWRKLTKVNYCQTLLKKDNLAIDEEENLIIKKIYPDLPEKSSSLEDLLKFWLDLLQNNNEQETEIITQLLELVEKGEVKHTKQLIAEMQTRSQNLQLQSYLKEDENAEESLLTLEEEELVALSDQFDFSDESEDNSESITATSDEEPTAVSGNLDEEPTIVLPMKLYNLTDSASTDIGRKRSHNEDFFFIKNKIDKDETPQGIKYEARGIYLVCDGMGGHAAGEVASSMAVKEVQEYFEEYWIEDKLPDIDLIKNAILNANKAIYDANLKKGTSGNQRMGTTLIMTLLKDTTMAIASVGDSRIYRITRKWGLEQLTTDHSVAQMDIKNGVSPNIAFARPDAYQLTQALGPRSNNFVKPDVTITEIKDDSLILLCSDGLSDNSLLEKHWETHLKPFLSAQTNLDQGLSELIDLANKENGHDNITGVLIRIKVQPDLSKKNIYVQ